MKKITLMLVVLFSVSGLLAEVNDGGFGFNLKLGIGGGSTGYGIGSDDATAAQAGWGAGGVFETGAMIHYSPIQSLSIAADFNYSTATLSELEYTDKDKKEKYTQTGEGAMYFADFRLGLRLFQEAGDLGYTYLFAGIRAFGANYKMTKLKVTDTETGVESYGTPLQETGASSAAPIFGFTDYSTIPTPVGAIGIISGAWIVFPVELDEVEEQGNTYKLASSEGIGGGAELGLAYAIESLGASVYLKWKGEGIAEAHRKEGALPTSEDDGYFQFYSAVIIGASLEF